jgi:O-antigen/teichoic acid export membrane protein
MTTARPDYNVARGTAYITGQQVIVYLTYFLFYVIITRVLSKADVGAVSLLAATMAVFNTATQLALPQAATRYMSRHLGAEERPLAGSVAKTTLRLTLLIAVPLALAALPFAPLINTFLFPSGQNYTSAVMLTFLTGVVIDVYLLYGAYFLGAGMYAEYAYQTILYIPLSRGLGVALALLGHGVLGIIAGWAVGGFAAIALSVVFWRNKLPQPRNYPVKPLLAFTLPLFAATLISLGQQWGDVGIIQFRLGQLATTGGYYIVISSVGFLSALWFPVANALYPSLSAAHARGDRNGMDNSLSLSFRLTNLAVLPLGAAVAAVASTALYVYGGSYASIQETIPFAILTITTVFQAQSAILTTTLQALGKTRVQLLVTVTATVVDLVWVWFFAPVLGTSAGAIGRALLYASTVYLSYRVLRWEVKTQPFHGLTKASLLALGVGLTMFLANQLLIYYLPDHPLLRLPILLVVFVGIFLALSRQLNIFHAGDFAMLKDVLPRRYHSFLRKLERLILSRQTAEALSDPH